MSVEFLCLYYDPNSAPSELRHRCLCGENLCLTVTTVTHWKPRVLPEMCTVSHVPGSVTSGTFCLSNKTAIYEILGASWVARCP